jgi:anti-sigma B factor antagonist
MAVTRAMSASTFPLPPADAAASTDLCVTSQVVGHRAVLGVDGEVDLDSVAALAAAIDSAEAAGATELWIDLSQTSFMDSSGLHLLLDTRSRMAQSNRRLAVICPAGCVRRLFDISGAAEALPLYEDRAAAHRAA